MVRRLVLFSGLASLALMGVPALSAATSIAGPNGKIVFASGRASSGIPAPDPGDADARIWVADYPGGTPVQVTTLPTGMQHRHPNWSPDHSKIVYAAGKAFSGEYALWIVDLRTGEQTEFVPKAKGQDRPTWSPDGTRIAYGSQGDLWVKGVAPGSVAEQLTNTAEFSEERPVWSPDGNTLYYNREKPPPKPGDPHDRDIFKKSPVTPGGAEEGVVTGSTDDWQPALSPNGSRLCFLRGPQSESADLYTVNANGTGAASFTSTANGELNCVWSPDGTRILYTLGAFGAGELATRDINGGSFSLLEGMNVASHFDGNADWATNFSPKCDAKSVSVGVNAFVSIGLSCVDPDAGFGASPPTPTPLDESAIELVSQPAHGTLGGLSDGKVIYTPKKDFKGTDSFTYTGSDGVSEAKAATVTIQVTGPPTGNGNGAGGGDKTPPSISGLRVSAKSWRRGRGLASISKAPVGTMISFKLSEAATVKVSFQHATRRNGKLRYVNAGSLAALAAKAGKNKVRFQGPLSRSRSLALGKYRVVVSARDAAGNQSQPRTGPTFTIVAE